MCMFTSIFPISNAKLTNSAVVQQIANFTGMWQNLLATVPLNFIKYKKKFYFCKVAGKILLVRFLRQCVESDLHL